MQNQLNVNLRILNHIPVQFSLSLSLSLSLSETMLPTSSWPYTSWCRLTRPSRTLGGSYIADTLWDRDWRRTSAPPSPPAGQGSSLARSALPVGGPCCPPTDEIRVQLC